MKVIKVEIRTLAFVTYVTFITSSLTLRQSIIFELLP
jgi:hypothetical protein